MSLLDTALRSYVAAFHADPWNLSTAQELDELLRRHVSTSGVSGLVFLSDSERIIAQQICGILSRGILSNKRGPSSSISGTDVVVLSSSESASQSGEHAFRSSSTAGPSVLCDDTRGQSFESSTGAAAGPRVTHVRVLCPVATVTGSGEASSHASHSCLVLWVRLSPLMGSISLEHADGELIEGHGFVEGVTAPGCPIQADDLVFFSRGADHDSTATTTTTSVTFVATRCVQEGAVRVSSTRAVSAAHRSPHAVHHPMITLRRVRCGLWSQPEDPIDFPDPTLWMDNRQLLAQSGRGGGSAASNGFLSHVCSNAVQWRQLQENVLRVESRNTFWAIQEGLAGGVSDSTHVKCTPLVRTAPNANPSGRLASLIAPWNANGWLAIVDGKTDMLIGLLASIPM
jgi:hypothetical protein